MKFLVVILLISLFLLISCDLFTTRDAQTPDTGRSNFQPPVQSDIVLQNLANSLSDKNKDNYIACFVDTIFAKKSFIFSASSEAAANYQIFLQGWGLSEEKSYITNLFNSIQKDLKVQLTLTDPITTNLGADSLLYTANYFLNVPIATSESSSSNYGGNLQFKMLRDNRSYWVIYYWKDTKSQTLPSWSDLKGNYY